MGEFASKPSSKAQELRVELRTKPRFHPLAEQMAKTAFTGARRATACVPDDPDHLCGAFWRAGPERVGHLGVLVPLQQFMKVTEFFSCEFLMIKTKYVMIRVIVFFSAYSAEFCFGPAVFSPAFV